MAKKKNFWYVIVMTNEGAKFVTSLDWSTKTAHWDGEEKPKEMSMESAKDLAMGLMLNFNQAYPVCSPIELDNQPYRYSEGNFVWTWEGDDKKNGD